MNVHTLETTLQQVQKLYPNFTVVNRVGFCAVYNNGYELFNSQGPAAQNNAEVYLWGVLAGIRIERANQLINQSVDKAIN